MAHDHHHHHHIHLPEIKSESKINFAFALAIILNTGFSLIEMGFALFAHSMGLLADAVHNFGDVAGLVLAWFANWLMRRKANDQFSYGYKKTTIIAALANALLIVAATALIGYESIKRLMHPEVINEPIVIAMAFLGIFINGGTALLFHKEKSHDLNIKGAFLHLAWDALISFGVVFMGIIIYFTQLFWLDPIVSLVIVLIIFFGTWELLRNSANLMLGATPHQISAEKVKNFLKAWPGVESIHDLHIWGLSTQEAALTVHLVMPNATLSDHDLELINSTLRDQYGINHVTIQVENGHLEDPCGQFESC